LHVFHLQPILIARQAQKSKTFSSGCQAPGANDQTGFELPLFDIYRGVGPLFSSPPYIHLHISKTSSNQTKATMDFVNKAKESLGSGSNNNQQQQPAQGQQQGGNAGQEDYGDKGMFLSSLFPSSYHLQPLLPCRGRKTAYPLPLLSLGDRC
jgi:hypothetical protein